MRGELNPRRPTDARSVETPHGDLVRASYKNLSENRLKCHDTKESSLISQGTTTLLWSVREYMSSVQARSG